MCVFFFFSQLCITISHLIKLASIDDLIELECILLQQFDSNKQNWIRVINRMVPEKVASLLEANLYLKNMTSFTNLTSEQRGAIKTLLNCFVSITEYGDWDTFFWLLWKKIRQLFFRKRRKKHRPNVAFFVGILFYYFLLFIILNIPIKMHNSHPIKWICKHKKWKSLYFFFFYVISISSFNILELLYWSDFQKKSFNWFKWKIIHFFSNEKISITNGTAKKS